MESPKISIIQQIERLPALNEDQISRFAALEPQLKDSRLRRQIISSENAIVQTLAIACKPFDPILDQPLIIGGRPTESYTHSSDFKVARAGLKLGILSGVTLFGSALLADAKLREIGTTHLFYQEAFLDGGRTFPDTDEQMYALRDARIQYGERFLELGARFGVKLPQLDELIDKHEDSLCPQIDLQRLYKGAVLIGAGSIMLAWHNTVVEQENKRLLADSILQVEVAGDNDFWLLMRG